MTIIYLTDSSCGFLVFSLDGKDIVYGESCTSERLKEFLTMLPSQTSVRVVIENSSLREELAAIMESFEIVCSHYTEKESLNIEEELKFQVLQSQLPQITAFDRRLRLILLFLTGMLCSVIAMYLIVAQPYFEIRHHHIERSVDSIQNISLNYSRTVDASPLLNEILFFYSDITIRHFEIGQDDSFTVIFISRTSGLGAIRLSQAESSSLIEGQTITVDGELYSIYTLTGTKRR